MEQEKRKKSFMEWIGKFSTLDKFNKDGLFCEN